MKRLRARTCLHCRQKFYPDPRSRHHQRYCSQSPCRRASKAASQRRWLAKPENQDYFRGPEHAERMREWRQRHPTSKKVTPHVKKNVLQDDCTAQPTEIKNENEILMTNLLQDNLVSQPYVLIGLISMLSGLSSQDDIDTLRRRLEQLGRDLADANTLGGLSEIKRIKHK